MIVLDTHAWLWWLTDDPRLSGDVRAALEHEAAGVSAMSCFEVALLVRRGRLVLDRDVRDWIRQALSHHGVRLLPLDAETAVEAALLDGDGFPGDPADRVIYATARRNGAALATKDRRMRSFDPAGTVW